MNKEIINLASGDGTPLVAASFNPLLERIESLEFKNKCLWWAVVGLLWIDSFHVIGYV